MEVSVGRRWVLFYSGRCLGVFRTFCNLLFIFVQMSWVAQVGQCFLTHQLGKVVLLVRWMGDVFHTTFSLHHPPPLPWIANGAPL